VDALTPHEYRACDSRPDSCRRLWRAIIARALEDAISGIGCTPMERSEATAFLVAERGKWARAREQACEFADLCPRRLREAYLRWERLA
jgi:hypothetical protein